MISALLLCVLAAEPAPDFHVSPGGNDAWSGRSAEPAPGGTDGPFRSLRRAQKAVRDLKAADPARQRPIVVQLRGGTYELEEPVVFRPEDSGTREAPVIYTAMKGEVPIVSGGVRLRGWQAAAGGSWTLPVPQPEGGSWRINQLFVEGERRPRPSLPEKGWYHVAEELPPSESSREKGHDRFRYAAGDLKEAWAHVPGVEVLAIHIWSASRMRIKSIDAAERIVAFTGTTRGVSFWSAFGKGHRYRVENVREALDAPGEWYFDEVRRELTYLPRSGESRESTVIVAPRIEKLLLFEGDVAGRRWVENIELRGLTLAHTAWSLPAEGSSFPQAEIQLPAAVEVIGGRGLRMTNCKLTQLGGYAIALGAGSRDNVIERCDLLDLGGGGVKIGQAGGAASWSAGEPKSEDPESHVSGNVVRDCLISRGGRIHLAAVGVWIGHASHCVIDHNTIEDFYYTGVSVGWVWGYAPSLAHHNEISHNRIATIGQGVLSDMAGVYTLGISPGTTVHHNWIQDVEAFDYGGWGLYTDEGSTGIVLEKNVVHRTKTGGFHQHYGRENLVRNNILAFARVQQLQRSREEAHVSFTFERNVVLWDNESPLLGSKWSDGRFLMRRNVYWNLSGRPVQFDGGLDLAGWQRERHQDEGSVVADPGFEDARAGKFALAASSPAIALGFEPWDLTDVGCRRP